MVRRLLPLCTIVALACGGHPAAVTPVPQTMDLALNQFLSAVKANDLRRMGSLMGTAEKGPWIEWEKPEILNKRLSVIQKYLAFTGYRVVEGPITSQTVPNVRTYRVELQRDQCSHVQPIDLVQARRGGWLVVDVHLESAPNPVVGCQPPPGTRP